MAGTNQGRKSLISSHPDYPDPWLLYFLSDLFPRASNPQQKKQLLDRFGFFLAHRFPLRPDLMLQLLISVNAYSLLKYLPDRSMPPSQYYSDTKCSVFHMHSLWVKGHYDQLIRDYCHYIFYNRWFPQSDFMLRGYTVLGLTDRVISLFRMIWSKYHDQLSITTVSNMMFTELGHHTLSQNHITNLVKDYRRLSNIDFDGRLRSESVLREKTKNKLTISEKPLLAVVSPDLRNHPVGRFWLPIAKKLSEHVNLVHLSLNAGRKDHVGQSLNNLSSEWYEFEGNECPSSTLHNLQPDILIDLGGHTADSQPQLLNHRFSPLQVTYLGFYGPSFGSECDWWILDDKIINKISNSYPMAEKMWSLPCPSLCYDPSLHGIPNLDRIQYTHSSTPVFGSFNHSRKLTDVCLSRFADVIESMEDSVLMFRSHSFYDHQVRRWFLDRLKDSGVKSHKLLPIPYATSALEGYLDFGRIHLHLDSYPVCGTTTTLDSLSMGVPVLTCPNHLYAGAISASILEHAGCADWVAYRASDLVEKATTIYQQYKTPGSRRKLAEQIRKSSLCDVVNTPTTFYNHLIEMLRIKCTS